MRFDGAVRRLMTLAAVANDAVAPPLCAQSRREQDPREPPLKKDLQLYSLYLEEVLHSFATTQLSTKTEMPTATLTNTEKLRVHEFPHRIGTCAWRSAIPVPVVETVDSVTNAFNSARSVMRHRRTRALQDPPSYTFYQNRIVPYNRPFLLLHASYGCIVCASFTGTTVCCAHACGLKILCYSYDSSLASLPDAVAYDSSSVAPASSALSPGVLRDSVGDLQTCMYRYATHTAKRLLSGQ